LSLKINLIGKLYAYDSKVNMVKKYDTVDEAVASMGGNRVYT